MADPAGDAIDNFWRERMVAPRRGAVRDVCVAAALLATATLVGFALDALGIDGAVIVVYVFVVQLCAFFTWNPLVCLVASGAAVTLCNFFFTGPRYTFAMLDEADLGIFAVTFVVSLVSSSVAVALRRALVHAATGSHRARMVLETNRMLQRCAGPDEIMRAVGTQLARLAKAPCVWYRMDGDGEDLVPACAYTPTGDVASMQMLAPEMPPFLSGSAYVGTPLDATFGGSQYYGIYLTVRSGDVPAGDGEEPPVAGVLAIAGPPSALSGDELVTADAIVSEAGLALDRVRALEARERAAVVAKNEQLRANLLRSISHDLRTPLTSIRGNADVLLDQGSTGTAALDAPTRRRMLMSIRSDALWLNDTVENLLAITKLEDGGMHLSLTLELMDDIVEEALRHVSPAAAEHRIETVPGPEPVLVNVDARLMVQLVVNLVDNAIKYTPEGSRITVAWRVARAGAVLSVADDGPGIAPADREHIFDSFYTVNHGLADGHRSVGLGLSLCRSIAAAHGGTIDVDAAEPHGAVFNVELPVADIDLDKEPYDA